MIYKGIKFRKSRTVVLLPPRSSVGMNDPDPVYVQFGRICPSDNRQGILTHYKYRESKEPVYALPIESKGYSRTNMMYGKDGRIYLVEDGICYTALNKRRD